MPTVLTIRSFSIRIRTNDHEPAHVHVVKGSGEAKIRLGIHGEPPDLITVSHGMNDRDAITALKIVEANNEYLLSRWREIHL